MIDKDIYDQLSEIFHDVFLRDDIVLTPETTAQDVEGWDSFKMIEIVMAVESRFAIKVKSKELDQLESVGDLIRLIAASRLTLND